MGILCEVVESEGGLEEAVGMLEKKHWQEKALRGVEKRKVGRIIDQPLKF